MKYLYLFSKSCISILFLPISTKKIHVPYIDANFSIGKTFIKSQSNPSKIQLIWVDPMAWLCSSLLCSAHSLERKRERERKRKGETERAASWNTHSFAALTSFWIFSLQLPSFVYFCPAACCLRTLIKNRQRFLTSILIEGFK